MNSTRIRYQEQADGTLVSVKKFMHPTRGEQFKIVITPAELSFKIVEDLSSTEVSTGRACNLHQVKIKAKAKLVELGISFESEARGKQEQAS